MDARILAPQVEREYSNTTRDLTIAREKYEQLLNRQMDAEVSQQAIVGGLSLGGYMSLAFYRAHPDRVRALLIIDTGPGFKKDEARDAWNKRAHETADRFEREGLDVLKSASRERSGVTHRDASGKGITLLSTTSGTIVICSPLSHA